MKKLTIVILIILSSLATYAQNDDLGLFAGASYYNGDLNPGTPFHMSLPAFGVFYRHNFTKRLAIRGGYTGTRLQGDDFQHRGLTFKTNLNELSVQFEVNFSDFGVELDENNLTPYIFGGIGSAWFTVKGKDSTGTINTLSSGLTNFPFGLGIKYNPIKNVSIGLEWGLRKTTGNSADQIDAVYFPGKRVSAANDWYAFAGLTVSFRLNFFHSERCDELIRH